MELESSSIDKKFILTYGLRLHIEALVTAEN